MTGTATGKRDSFAAFSAKLGLTSLVEALPQRDRLVILNYHRIGDPSLTPYDSGTFSTTAEGFDVQIRFLQQRFHMATLEEATGSAIGGSARGVSILITFDDGYLDNYTAAFPILKSRGVQGVFFLPTAFVGTGRIPWWDTLAYILKHSRQQRIHLDYPDPADYDLTTTPVLRVIEKVLAVCKRNDVDTNRLIAALETACECARPDGAERCFLSWDEARKMKAAGMAFGSHTHTHEILAKLSAEQQAEELCTSRQIIERELSQQVESLAYPVGLPSTFSSVTKEVAARSGYKSAFSFYGGANVPGQTEQFNIRRFALADPAMPRLRLQTSLLAVTGSYWF